MVFSYKQFQESPSVIFEKDDISFTCPKGWSITDEDNLDGIGYYLSIEKDGFDSSGLMTVSWLYETVNPDDLILAYQEDMQENVIYKHSNLVFDPTFENKFQHYTVKSTRYQVTIVGIKHQGIISAVNYGDQTFGILKQGATEDVVINKKGFEMIESSFRIKEIQ
ncbi:hypothetical protein FEE95_04900 [Maribacter algarum]|uniref:Uncharacterized protein n=1 Tax=Maribacter algarum (ex Zhang et al. 2020) TaxID=2578118 RepID=A0A5S3PUY3_9FLAO|nr:hypothetical protein [Maribacter algarum]TMM58773.1 hypothetical protein FEE95_04900 [Maribacter algarum]